MNPFSIWEGKEKQSYWYLEPKFAVTIENQNKIQRTYFTSSDGLEGIYSQRPTGRRIKHTNTIQTNLKENCWSTIVLTRTEQIWKIKKKRRMVMFETLSINQPKMILRHTKNSFVNKRILKVWEIWTAAYGISEGQQVQS